MAIEFGNYQLAIEYTVTNGIFYRDQFDREEESENMELMERYINPFHYENELTLQIHLGFMDMLQDIVETRLEEGEEKAKKVAEKLARGMEPVVQMWEEYVKQGIPHLVYRSYKTPEDIALELQQIKIGAKVNERVLEEQREWAQLDIPPTVPKNIYEIEDYRKEIRPA